MTECVDYFLLGVSLCNSNPEIEIRICFDMMQIHKRLKTKKNSYLLKLPITLEQTS